MFGGNFTTSWRWKLMSTTCLGGEFHHLFVDMFGVQLISSSICMVPKMTLMRSSSSSTCCSLPCLFQGEKQLGIQKSQWNLVISGCIPMMFGLVVWLDMFLFSGFPGYFQQRQIRIWNWEVQKVALLFPWETCWASKGTKSLERKRIHRDPKSIPMLRFREKRRFFFPKKAKRRNPKKDHGPCGFPISNRSGDICFRQMIQNWEGQII